MPHSFKMVNKTKRQLCLQIDQKDDDITIEIREGTNGNVELDIGRPEVFKFVEWEEQPKDRIAHMTTRNGGHCFRPQGRV